MRTLLHQNAQSTYNAANPNLEVANNENVGGKDVSDKITIVNSNIESRYN
ncbi:hypothetical protein J4710_10045 [Staphylococcus xylosus]|uniref:Uncharacterized protein n=1 Tax=Staphylococcus xylosus TaxID=1288 RepID=A0A939NH67_STAXY|nr:hypothetical protein [Staphylococcus xylosus]